MKKFFRHGLIVGKFHPLHAGHSHLIRTALASCRRLTVLVIGSPEESIPLEIRVAWVQEEHPNAVVRSATEEAGINFSGPAAWDQHTALVRGMLDAPVDVIFSSNAHGAELARRVKARWIRIDPDRRHTPVSGAALRNDLAGYWWALTPAVRQYFAQRAVVVGTESSGAGELAQQLAEQFGVPCVPDFSREWAAVRPGGLWAPWHAAEFEFITLEQLHAEERGLRATPEPLVVCAGDMLSTALWNERLLGPGSRTQSILRKASAHPPLLYLLADEDPSTHSESSSSEDAARRRMQQRFRDVLQNQNTPWTELRGTPAARLNEAKAAVQKQLQRQVTEALSFAQSAKHPAGLSYSRNVANGRG